MKIKNICFITLVILLGALYGCSDNKKGFDEENVTFNVVNSEATDEYKSYEIEIANNSGFNLSHLSLNLNYPIKTSKGSKSNPYVVQGTTEHSTRPINLTSGETITFSIIAPIKEVFANSSLLDFEKPNIMLEGYYKDGEEEIPFGISGGINVLILRGEWIKGFLSDS